MNRGALGELRRRPGYAPMYGASLLGRLANEMAPVGVVLFVLDRTGSAVVAGLVVAAASFPSVVTGPLLGAWLDRSRRRIAMIAGDAVVSIATLALLIAAAGNAADWTLPLIALASGVTYPLVTGGFTSLLPSIVGERLRRDANALEATNFHLGVIAGPALAAVLAAISPLTAVLVQLGLKAMALALTVRLRDPRPEAPADMSVRSAARDGLTALLRTPPLLAVTTAGALSLGGRGLLVIGFPFFAAEQLGTGKSFAGWMWAAFAAGSIAGALGFGRLQHRYPTHTLALGGIAACAVVMATWPLAEAPATALALCALAGFVYGPGFVAQFGVRQEWAPPELQAQVFMTAAATKPALFAIGSAVGGVVIADWGAEALMLTAAAVQMAAALVGVAILRPTFAAPQPNRY